jgi:hypothetical protein
VESLALKKHFRDAKNWNKSGSGVHFELFLQNEIVPHSVWQVHTEHDRMRRIISKEDYKKAARHLNVTYEEFIEEIKKYC